MAIPGLGFRKPGFLLQKSYCDVIDLWISLEHFYKNRLKNWQLLLKTIFPKKNKSINIERVALCVTLFTA